MKAIETRLSLKEAIIKMVNLIDEGWDGELVYDRNSETWSITE
jgi:hypothetical protein